MKVNIATWKEENERERERKTNGRRILVYHKSNICFFCIEKYDIYL